jgi:hypothetical protein
LDLSNSLLVAGHNYQPTMIADFVDVRALSDLSPSEPTVAGHECMHLVCSMAEVLSD